jgi:hypothetical protein
VSVSPAVRRPGRVSPAALRPVVTHLLVPVLLGVGMALAYLGGFHQPSPHHLQVGVVGSSAQHQLLAQQLQDHLGDAIDVRTVPSEAQARELLEHRELAGAFVPGRQAAALLIASGASDTTAVTVERIFAPVALAQAQPLRVVDVAPVDQHDPTGQGIFFYLVALTVGAYSAAIAIAAAGGHLWIGIRAAFAVLTGLVVSALATAVAGPLYGALPSHVLTIGGLGWLYATSVILIGIGLHTFLGRWTTGVMVALFVMLNFTSSGGVFAPDLQPWFFAALHTFWIGAGLLEAGRNLLYFPQLGVGGDVVRLLLWLGSGALLVAVAGRVERRRDARALRTTVVA